jgi:hypothetical protein
MDVPETPFITRQQLAVRLHVAPGTIANWAARGEGPDSRMLGGRILYRLEDVEAWEAEQWTGESSSAGPKPAAKRATAAAVKKTTAGRRGSSRA